MTDGNASATGGASPAFERVLALTSIPALRDLHPDDLASLARQVEERRVAPGRACSADEGSDRPIACLLLAGELLVGPEGRRVEGPALVGTAELLSGSPLEMRAGRDGARVLTVDRDALHWVMTDVYDVCVAVLRHIALRWTAAEQPTAEIVRSGHSSAPGSPSALAARIGLLSASPLLRSVRTYTLARLACGMEEVELPAGAPLWERDATSDDWLVLAQGELAREPGSDDDRSRYRTPGTVLGLGEALARTPRSSRVTAASTVRLLRVTAETLIDELEDDPHAAAALLEGIARRVLRAESRAGRSR